MLSAASSTFGPPAPSCRLELRLNSPHISVRIFFLPPPPSLKLMRVIILTFREKKHRAHTRSPRRARPLAWILSNL